MAAPVRAPASVFPLEGIAVGVACVVVVLLPDKAAMLAIGLLAFACFRPAGRPVAPGPAPWRADALVRAAFVFLMTAVASSLHHGIGADGAVALWEFSVIAIVALAVRNRRHLDLVPALWWAVSLGAVAAAMIAVSQSLVGDATRPSGLVNAIRFGDIALTFGLLAFALRPAVRGVRPALLHGVGVVAAAAGILAAILSASRGAWVAVPLLGLLLLVDHVRRRGAIVGFLTLLIVMGAVVGPAAMANGGTALRSLDAGLEQTISYLDDTAPPEAAETSVGARFEMWQSALDAFGSEQVVGIGWGNLDTHFDRQVAEGLRTPRIANFEHAHNQILSHLGSGGILGAAALIVLLLVPLWIFGRAFSSEDPEVNALGTAGLIVVVGFAVYGLTESILENLSPVLVFGLLVAVLVNRLDQIDGRVDIAESDQAVDTDPDDSARRPVGWDDSAFDGPA